MYRKNCLIFLNLSVFFMDDLLSALPYCSLANSTSCHFLRRLTRSVLVGSQIRSQRLSNGRVKLSKKNVKEAIFLRAFRGSAFRLHCLRQRVPRPSNPAYVALKNPSMDFLMIAELLCNSACANPPSMARY